MKLKRTEWLVFAGLLLLSLIPCVGGTIRLIELGLGTTFEFLPVKTDITSTPFPVQIHLATAIPYCVLGIGQFLPSIRRRHQSLHRIIGRMLALAGAVSVLSALWMTHYYEYPDGDQSTLLYVVRITVGITMLGSICLGVANAMKRKIGPHRAWMIRAYALGQGAGTQSLIGIPWVLAAGELTGTSRDVVMTGGWVINALVAEWIIRRQRYRSSNRKLVQVGHAYP